MRHFLKLMLCLSALLVATGCSSSGGDSSSETLVASNPEQGPLSVFDTNIYAMNKVVCDPFDPGSPGPNDGLIATLYYKGTDQPIWGSVNDFLNLGQKSPKRFFFSTLNVPTRTFSMGFPIETGGMVQNDNNEDLIEYFALSFSSVLKLSAPDEEGLYELALLSDDGAIFNVRQTDGNYRAVVSNDGVHPTRFGCGERITMTRETELMVKLDYHQGPRYHISLIPMWRKVTEATPADPLCGASGNDLFFKSSDNSAPQAAYNALLSRGWKPIAADNWNLPAFAIFNPCTTGVVPVISHMTVESVEGQVIVNWRTDVTATSQVLVTNVVTGEETLSVSDNILRPAHRVLLNNLTLGQTYDIKAISISADYGKAQSAPIRITVN